MNTEKVMEKVLQYLESAEVFTRKEIPIYVSELITYKLYEQVLCVMLGLMTTLIIFLVVNWTIKVFFKTPYRDRYNSDYKSRWDSGDDSGQVIPVIIFSLSFIFGTIIVINLVGNSIELIKIKTAPRVYLIDYIRGQK